MYQKNIAHGSALFFAGVLLLSCSGAIRKPEPRKTPIYVTKVQATDSRGNNVVDKLTPLEKYSLNVELINFGQQAVPAGKIQMRSSHPQVRMEKSVVPIPTMAPRQRSFLQSLFEFSVSQELSPLAVNFSARGEPGSGIDFKFNLGEYNLPVRSDSVQVVGVLVNDFAPGGNSDGRLNPGETVNLFIQLRNIGSRFIDTSRAIISTLQLGVGMIDNSITFPPMPPGEVVTSLDFVRLSVVSNYTMSTVPLKMTFTEGIQGEKNLVLALLNDIIVCLESISITRGSWLPGCLIRNPDLLAIRLSICNETVNNLSNVVAQILASNIKFCGDNIWGANTSQYQGDYDRVYFGTINKSPIDIYPCAHATTPCTYTDGFGNNQNVPYPTEFTYIVTNLPADPKLCLSFDIELFYDNNIMNCQIKANAIPDWNQIVGASTNIPAIPACP